MADIDLKRVHSLGLAGARAAAERMAEDLGRRFDLRSEWQGNVLHFTRTGLNGTLEVGAQDLRLAVTLSFLLKALRGSLERAIHEELDGLFASAATPKKDPPPPRKGR